MTGTVLILGASSAIAHATASAFAAKGYHLVLAGRSPQELQRNAQDLSLRHGVTVTTRHFDALDFGSHQAFYDRILQDQPDLAGMVYAIGLLEDQAVLNKHPELSRKVIDANYTAGALLLSLFANHFESRQSGFLIGISSVAGDRGRQSNYTYGASKGAFSLFLQGLRNRLAGSGVRVITIKPGFVDTAMTWGMPGLFLLASPEQVGRKIAQAPERWADVRYIPWFWRYIMLIIKTIPEFLFKRMKL